MSSKPSTNSQSAQNVPVKSANPKPVPQPSPPTPRPSPPSPRSSNGFEPSNATAFQETYEEYHAIGMEQLDAQAPKLDLSCLEDYQKKFPMSLGGDSAGLQRYLDEPRGLDSWVPQGFESAQDNDEKASGAAK